MLKAGADLGNSGPRRDGVDGVVGRKTKAALNAAINTDQSPDFDEVWSGKHNIMNPRDLKSLTKRFTVNREKYAARFKKGVSDDASALPKDPPLERDSEFEIALDNFNYDPSLLPD